MASKKDLVEGQAFSRRRLITAFVSGAPGGREVEPGKPLRAVVGGVVLSVVLVVGALAVGLLSPTLASGWDDNSLVIAKDSGARYVALNSVLYPVINTTSARLLIPSGFKVVSAPDNRLTDSKRGPTVGIIGAPDALPAESALIDTGWASCTSRNGGLLTRISTRSGTTKVTDQAVVAVVGTHRYIIDNGFRYEMPDNADAVLRALALDTVPVDEVSAAWVNLFAPGPDLAPVTVPGFGEPVPGVGGLPAGITVGSVVTGSAAGGDDRRYVVLAGGQVTQLSDVGYALYRLGSGADQNAVITLNPATLGALPTGAAIAPTQWPTALPKPLQQVPCAVLTSGTGGKRPTVALASTTSITPQDGTTATDVDPGGGAIIRAIGAASLDTGPVVLVDQTGTAFPLLGSGSDQPLPRLGFSDSDIVAVPQAWLALFTAGPTLSVAAAGTEIAASTQTGK